MSAQVVSVEWIQVFAWQAADLSSEEHHVSVYSWTLGVPGRSEGPKPVLAA